MKALPHFRWAAIAALILALAQAGSASGESVKALTEAYNASGQALYQELAVKPGNIVLSPYSIGAAMAMVRSGARGATEVEMTTALKHRLSRTEADAANAALIAFLNGADRHSVELAIANALMLTKAGDIIRAEYRSIVREKYAAEIHAGATLPEINDWVKRKTKGKIESILDELSPEAPAVLLNAVHFKAAWANTFKDHATRDERFYLSAAQTVQVPLMHQQAEFRLVEEGGYRALRLDYTVRQLGMIIVLPNEIDGVEAVTGALDAGAFSGLAARLAAAPPRLVSLALPRFKAAFKADLAAPFRRAGMLLAFGESADFSGMTGYPGEVRIGAINHRAMINVTEEGTEAAAATAVVMMPPKGPPMQRPQPVPFIVDRPFAFFVVDDTSGAVLFQGRIADPRMK